MPVRGFFNAMVNAANQSRIGDPKGSFSDAYREFTTEALSPGTQTAGHFFLTDGRVGRTLINGTTSYQYWLDPQYGMELYSVRCTLISGSALAGGSAATGTWLSLATNRSFFVSRSTFGTTSATVKYEFALTADTSTILLTTTNKSMQVVLSYDNGGGNA